VLAASAFASSCGEGFDAITLESDE
jgi:hypothetical protein